MSQITLDGVLRRSGIASDPVVFIDLQDQSNFDQWRSTQEIFTKIIHHPHPDTGASCPTVYISQSAAQPFQDGTRVKITLAVRTEKRGNGIKIVSVV